MALSSLLCSSWTLESVRLLVSPDPVFWSEANVARRTGKYLTLCGPMELQDPVTDSSPERTSLLQCFPSTPDLQHGSSQAQGPGRGGATLLHQHLVWRVENSGACLLGGGGGKHNAVEQQAAPGHWWPENSGKSLSLFFFFFLPWIVRKLFIAIEQVCAVKHWHKLPKRSCRCPISGSVQG